MDAKGTVMAWTGQRDGLPPPGSSIAGSALFALARSLASGGGTGELIGHGGQPEVWAVAAAPGLKAAGLQVMLGLPRHTLAARAELRLRQGLGVLCGAALLLFAGVWSLAERGIRRPVSRITEMVRALGAGDLSARIALPHPRGELGGLMAVFNHTAGALQSQRGAIDELGIRLREAHLREIDEREANEARLSRMANFDSLTGLPNRTQFRERLRQAITRANRSGKPFALMFLDIDRFKHINDSLGHDIGDRLLVAVSGVLSNCLRGTDALARSGTASQTDGVFRLGGDEFTILTDELAGPSSVAAVAQRILETLRRPFTIGEHELFTSASLGLTVYAGADAGTDDGTDLDALVKQADMAMYRAKELGRDTFFIYDADLNTEAVQRHGFEAQLRHALDRNEFVLHYQPKADLASGRVTGVEALVRWQPAGEAMVGPDRFIPVLEETGLIVDVGAWVLREACAQMVRWQRAGMRPLSLAVNVSARQFRQPDLVGDVAEILAQTGFDPERLEVELTESMLIDDSGTVLATLAGLRTMGVRIAIDDFGTGQSSLRYLKRFNVDSLKIDRSFVMDTPDDIEDSAIAAAVIALAHGLHLNVVAEGVETQAQVDFLRSHGCHEMQGYLLSRPVDAPSFARWFEHHEAPALAEIA